MKKPCDRASVPGPWNRQERRWISVLREMANHAETAVVARQSHGLPFGYDRERANALDWALVEIEKSRAALDAARGGGK